MSISRAVAETIAQKACAKSFAAERAEEEKEEARLAELCWADVFRDEADMAQSLPRRWVCYDKCLLFNIGGWNVYLNHPQGLPVPAEGSGCIRLGTVSVGLAQDVRVFISKRDAAKDRRNKTLSDLAESIYAARSYKKLLEAWPEGREFYEGYLSVEKTKGTALAVPFQAINKTLGIGKETEACARQ